MRNIKNKIILHFGGSVAAIVVFLAVLSIIMQRKQLIAELDKDLTRIARIQKELLPPNFHDNISNEHSVSPEDYFFIVDRNNKLCKDLNL